VAPTTDSFSLQISVDFGGKLKMSKKQKAAKLPHYPGSVRRQFERGGVIGRWKWESK